MDMSEAAAPPATQESGGPSLALLQQQVQTLEALVKAALPHAFDLRQAHLSESETEGALPEPALSIWRDVISRLRAMDLNIVATLPEANKAPLMGQALLPIALARARVVAGGLGGALGVNGGWGAGSGGGGGVPGVGVAVAGGMAGDGVNRGGGMAPVAVKPGKKLQTKGQRQREATCERIMLRLIFEEVHRAHPAMRDPGQDVNGLREQLVHFKGPLDGWLGMTMDRQGGCAYVSLRVFKACVKRVRDVHVSTGYEHSVIMKTGSETQALLDAAAYTWDVSNTIAVRLWSKESVVVTELTGINGGTTLHQLLHIATQKIHESPLGPVLGITNHYDHNTHPPPFHTHAEPTTAQTSTLPVAPPLPPFVLVVKLAHQQSEVSLFERNGDVWAYFLGRDEGFDMGYLTEMPVSNLTLDALLLRKSGTRCLLVPRRDLEMQNGPHTPSGSGMLPAKRPRLSLEWPLTGLAPVSMPSLHVPPITHALLLCPPHRGLSDLLQTKDIIEFAPELSHGADNPLQPPDFTTSSASTVASFFDTQPYASKVVVIADGGQTEGGAVLLSDGVSVSYQELRSLWLGSASYAHGSYLLVVVEATGAAMWVDALANEVSDLRMGIQACSRSANGPPSLADAFVEFNRPTSTAWVDMLRDMASRGCRPSAVVTGLPAGQPSYSFGPTFRLMGSALVDSVTETDVEGRAAEMSTSLIPPKPRLPGPRDSCASAFSAFSRGMNGSTPHLAEEGGSKAGKRKRAHSSGGASVGGDLVEEDDDDADSVMGTRSLYADTAVGATHHAKASASAKPRARSGSSGGGMGGDTAQRVQFERVIHGHKHEFFLYLLKTCPPGTFAIHDLSSFVDEVAQANQALGNVSFDKGTFEEKLQQQQKGAYKPINLETGEVNQSQHVLKNMCNKPWAFWFLWKSGLTEFPSSQEFKAIQEFLRRQKLYDKWEKTLMKNGQKLKVKKKLSEHCPTKSGQQLADYLSMMAQLPEAAQSEIRDDVYAKMQTFKRTDREAVRSALRSGVLLWVDGRVAPNMALMKYWTEKNGCWHLAQDYYPEGDFVPADEMYAICTPVRNDAGGGGGGDGDGDAFGGGGGFGDGDSDVIVVDDDRAGGGEGVGREGDIEGGGGGGEGAIHNGKWDVEEKSPVWRPPPLITAAHVLDDQADFDSLNDQAAAAAAAYTDHMTVGVLPPPSPTIHVPSSDMEEMEHSALHAPSATSAADPPPPFHDDIDGDGDPHAAISGQL